jgi:hypothetical protein
MSFTTMRLSLAFVLLLTPLAAAAQSAGAPKSISDCERIKGDLAYNQCLASFGPKHGERATRSSGDADETVDQLSFTGRSARRTAGGRQSATFDIMSEGRADVTGAARQRR